MDLLKLKKYAEILDAEIKKNIDKSKDVEFMANYQSLTSAIEDAKNGKIDGPRTLGDWFECYWVFESNIRDYPFLAENLAKFEILLKGQELSEG